MTEAQSTSAASSKGAVLFDIDGTLIDSTYHHAVAWHRAFTRHGHQVPMWRVHRTIGMGGDKLVTEVAGEEVETRDGEKLREAWREEYAELSAEVEPFAGAGELVRSIDSSGYVVALASSGEKEFAEQAVGDLGIREQVRVLTTSDDADNS